MATYNTWEELIQECEKDMLDLEQNKEYSFSIHAFMKQKVDNCIKSGDYASLLELLPYFEEPDNYSRLHYSSETRRIYILLCFLKLELKYGKESFLSTVSCYQEFTQQYTLTVFAMRRLELSLSDHSMQEATSYLSSVPLTIYAARLISENEYFENYQNLYWNLYICMKESWSVPDQIQWMICLLKKSASSKALLELSSLYMDIGAYQKAYLCLIRIPSPSPETTTLISSLKELLPDE